MTKQEEKTEGVRNLLSPSLEQFVTEIVAVNRGWKVARDLFGEDSDLAVSLRHLKDCLQVRLLRNHTSEVYLVLDWDEKPERIYSIRIREPVGGREDAERIPARILDRFFKDEELKSLVREE